MYIGLDDKTKIAVVKFMLQNGWMVAIVRERSDVLGVRRASAIAYPAWMDGPEKLIPSFVEEGPQDVEDWQLLEYIDTVRKKPVPEGPKMDLIV